ncbi:hypothetical protein AKJ56_00690 [candidate division MSBL1 archaeon SCGC-AAA382N08]|uniref:Amidohydrolase-related domain-containing protein n=1 Tax=candidate division MSBL1 archaeon SCGC-AAA382N08 TaxID=1698285 RepID=A0A133VQC9_9EURY|nr:hypothetical protein AKJ56_00690 [candidate division MSBL1 archaeon SCGC-AAA382N08]
MRIFKNALIFSGNELELVEGYMKIEDGVISEIREGKPEESGVDMGGAFILPPFVNAHTHLGDSIEKDLYIGKKQPEVVGSRGEKFKALNKSSDVDKIRAIRESLHDMKESGILVNCDFREGGVQGANLLKESKIEGLKTLTLSRPSRGESVDDLLSKSDGVGLSSIDSVSGGKMEEVSEKCFEQNKLLSFHVSETQPAHDRSIKNTGRTEIERALDFDPSFLVHATWAGRDDLKLLRESDVPLILCARANSLLSDGIPPVKEALEENLELWIGTDNVTVCAPIILQELSFLWSILRLQTDEAGREDARELLKAATVNPLNDLGMSFNSLREGEKAAFVVLSKGNNLQDCKDPYVGIVNRARVDNVEMVYYPEG